MFRIVRLWIILSVFSYTTKAQIISTVAGGGAGGLGDGGLATDALVLDPHGGAFDNQGNLYIVEGTGHLIRKVDISGNITTVAGTGSAGYNGDNIPATTANITPNALTVDSIGNLYITDSALIRKIDIGTGLISTVAGLGGVLADGGPATAASFQVPWGICFDKKGNLLFGEVLGHRLRKISSLGIISTVAGVGTFGFSGDGGPATAAHCNQVFGVCVDNAGNIYIADAGNSRVRKIDSSGVITTVAGNGTTAYSGDSISATNAHLAPLDVRIDANDNLYIADIGNNRIRMVNASGIIHTITGTGVAGYNGDGILADTAQIHIPGGLALDGCGEVYFGDVGNGRFRKVMVPPVYTIPSITLSSPSVAHAGTTVPVTATVANAGSSYTIHWLNHGAEFTTTTVPFVIYTKGPGIDTITARIVPTGYGCWDSTTSASRIIGLPSGIGAVSASATLSVYPNPVSNMLTVAMYGVPIMRVAISNLLGQQVINKEYNASQVQVDVSSLPAGVYFAKVNGIYIQKFIKQ